MAKPIIAAQMYTARDFMKNDEDFVKAIATVKEIGFTAVQLSGHGAVSPDCITETLAKENIKCCITHSPLDRIINDTENIVKEHKAWGCDRVGVGGGVHMEKGLDGFREFAKLANEIGDELAKYGMKFCYHNHSAEFIRYDGIAGMDILIGETNDNVEFIPDCFWLQYAGINPYGWLKQLKGRVSTIHYKDFAVGPDGKPMITEIGHGNMDHVLLTDVCEEIGVKYAAIEQDSCPGNPFDSLRFSFNYLKSIGLN